jgi:hypothetical protein
MEVTEFDPDRAMAVVIHDGDNETLGRMTCESAGPDRTKIVITADMPWMDDSADAGQLEAMIQGSADSIKTLIESEL